MAQLEGTKESRDSTLGFVWPFRYGAVAVADKLRAQERGLMGTDGDGLQTGICFQTEILAQISSDGDD